MLGKALDHRQSAKTNANATSSRGHSDLRLNFIGEDGKTTGILNLVDMVEGETSAESGASIEQRKEQCDINSSLGALKRVFAALARGDDYIPYRDHKVRLSIFLPWTFTDSYSS